MFKEKDLWVGHSQLYLFTSSNTFKVSLLCYFRCGHICNHLCAKCERPFFIVQKGRQNEKDLARKFDNNILITYGIQNHDFQEDGF